MSNAEIADVTRRTRLAAERTWLAWWRTGIAATTASIAVGGLVPQLVEGAGWPFILLGVGYAVLAVTLFAAGELRKRAVDEALDKGRYAPLPAMWTMAFSGAGGVLAVATLLVVIFAQ
jgi:inner membrane protein YidH